MKINEKDILATMIRIKLKRIMQDDDIKNHSHCYCNSCLLERVKNHDKKCNCNICKELKTLDKFDISLRYFTLDK